MSYDGAAWIEWQRAKGAISEREADRAMHGDGVIPHRWDGEHWICLQCEHVSTDPCDCRCHE